MNWKEFFKLNNGHKVFSFIMLLFLFSLNYYRLGYDKIDIPIIKFGYPMVMIIGAYFMACATGELIKNLKKVKEKSIKRNDEQVNVLEFIITRWHFATILILITVIPALIFGKIYGNELIIVLPFAIAFVYFLYWIYYKNKFNRGITGSRIKEKRGKNERI